MSTYWMWSVAMQRYRVDRVKVLEFLILLGVECCQLSNFMSFMEIMAALEHGTVLRFKQAWEEVSKTVSSLLCDTGLKQLFCWQAYRYMTHLLVDQDSATVPQATVQC